MSHRLAIDPGTRSLGYALFSDAPGPEALVAHETIKAPSSDYVERIQQMIRELDQIYADFELDVLVVEQPGIFASHESRESMMSGNLQKLSFMVGALIAWASLRTVTQIELVPVAKWKGNWSKEKTLQRLKEYYPGLDVKSLDESDAIGIGHYSRFGSLLESPR